MRNPLHSLTGRFMLYSSLVLLLLMGVVFAYQSSIIRRHAEASQFDKGRTMAISLSKSLQSLTESDLRTGVMLKDGTKLSGEELRTRLFDDRLEPIAASREEAQKRSKDKEYASAKQKRFDGQDIPLAQYEMKYTSAYGAYTDERWQAMIDGFLTDPQIVFAIPIAYSANPEAVGFIATHNSSYSPQGESSKDSWGGEGLLSQKYRANRVFNDPTGYAAATYKDTSEVLLQTYPRSVEGRVVETWDMSYPLYFEGKHWGAVRVALNKEQSDELIARQQLTVAVELLIVLLVVLGLLFVLAKFSVARKLQAMLEATANLNSQEADLTYRLAVRGKDEMGRLSGEINRFIAHLQQMMKGMHALSLRVTDGSHQLAAHAAQSREASEAIAHTLDELAAGAESQAASAGDSAKAMEEMVAGIQRIAEASAHVTEASLAMVQEAEAGNRTSVGAMEQMGTMRRSAQQVGQAFRELEGRMQSVREMAGAISGIASQTGLLALNAAIEAARAGEHGRGFAVVAGEVRKLAEQSEASAQRIHEQIEAIQASMASAVSAMDKGGREVEKGVGEVEQAGAAFGRILTMAQGITAQIQEISAASEQLSAGTEEVTAGIEEMARIAGSASEQTLRAASASAGQLDLAGQASGEAEQLQKAADELQQTAGRFKV